MASVPCAIELEPKTLNPEQISHARELAVVFQQIEPQGTSDLFIQELERVDSIGVRQIIEGDNVNSSRNMEDVSSKDMESTKRERTHNCLCKNLFIEYPDEICHKEPVTAPF
ncbi:hypothetical protein KSS87_017820 [Heliosperma pusillum]|nr:hypothetical protein KSS87_017820 [Heliosperma pusillum]